MCDICSPRLDCRNATSSLKLVIGFALGKSYTGQSSYALGPGCMLLGHHGPFTIARIAPSDDSFPHQSGRNSHRRLYGTPKIFTGRFIEPFGLKGGSRGYPEMYRKLAHPERFEAEGRPVRSHLLYPAVLRAREGWCIQSIDLSEPGYRV